MRTIHKLEEPDSFKQWKSPGQKYQDLAGNRPVYEEVVSSLEKEQGGICCYCENELRKDSQHIEHLKPRSKFPNLDLEYSNLLLSCGNPQNSNPDPRCGVKKDDWYDVKLFVPPLDPNSEKKFTYTQDGRVEPASSLDLAAEQTIEVLNLNQKKLRETRKQLLFSILQIHPNQEMSAEVLESEEINHFVLDYLKPDPEGRLKKFPSALRSVFLGD